MRLIRLCIDSYTNKLKQASPKYHESLFYPERRTIVI